MSLSCLSVCLSVCLHAYLRNHTSELHDILPVAVVRSSSSDKCCTSGFADDVTFSHNERYGGVTLGQQPGSNVVSGITRSTACYWLRRVPDDGVGTKTRRVPRARVRAGAEYAMRRCFVLFRKFIPSSA